jgi:hypothetical protein
VCVLHSNVSFCGSAALAWSKYATILRGFEKSSILLAATLDEQAEGLEKIAGQFAYEQKLT